MSFPIPGKRKCIGSRFTNLFYYSFRYSAATVTSDSSTQTECQAECMHHNHEDAQHTIDDQADGYALRHISNFQFLYLLATLSFVTLAWY